MSRRTIPAILLAISVLGIAIAGLTGKGFVATNDVAWVSDPPALEFRGNGLAYTGVLSLSDSAANDEGATLFLVLDPDRGSFERGFQIVATFSSGESKSQLAVAQWQRQLIVMNGDDYEHDERRPRLTTEVDDDADRFVFLAIRLGDRSSELFVDGVRASALSSTFKLPPEDAQLRLILGDSFELRNAWSGRIAGLALFEGQLPEAELARTWQHWATHRRFSLAAPAAASVYYDFAQPPGAEVTDLSGRGNDLLLPRMRKPLRPDLASLSLQPSSTQDMWINVLGFIPFGFLLAWVLGSGTRFSSGGMFLLVIIAGGLLSGAIEVSQAWLPARTSSFLDLILNVSGAACGAIIHRLGIATTHR